MKRFFHSELSQFRSNMVLMGERSIENVRLAMQALSDRDIELCQRVVEQDKEIDRLEMTIDTESIRYISLRSPVARELRLLFVGMRFAHDLERVGDKAVTIARRSREIIARGRKPDLLGLPEMAETTLTLLRDTIDSFLDENVEAAFEVIRRDAEVDALNARHLEVLTRQLDSGSADASTCLNLIFISKALERIADHATNLAEEVIFLLKGEDVRHSSLRGTEENQPAPSKDLS